NLVRCTFESRASRAKVFCERAGEQRDGEKSEEVDGDRVLGKALACEFHAPERLPRGRKQRGWLEVLRRDQREVEDRAQRGDLQRAATAPDGARRHDRQQLGRAS